MSADPAVGRSVARRARPLREDAAPRTPPILDSLELPLSRMLRWFENSLLAIGLLLLGLWLMIYVQARAFENIETQKFESSRVGTEAPAGPEPASALPGAQPKGAAAPAALESGVFGRLEIPRLGISALIAEGIEPKQLRRAVGHVPLSALPGQPGNCALAGHRDSFLKGLGAVRRNDVIRIATLGDTYTYKVSWGAVVEPEQVSVLASTEEPALTLVTCYPFEAVGPAPDRFVVRATLVERN